MSLPRVDSAIETDPDRAARAVERRAVPIDAGLDDLADEIADADVVLMGEASHGTSEYYRLRARLSARLLDEHDFSFVAVEGDWADCFEVARYATGRSDAERARDVLEAFERWPTWMWANWEVVEFVEWLRDRNEGRPAGERTGFYGLDVYGLYESMAAVIEYLEEYDPDAADRAREAYECFDPYEGDAREYARATRLSPEDCEDEVVEVLEALRADGVEAELPSGASASPTDADETGTDGASVFDDDPGLDLASADDLEAFAAEQNALVARNAEAYYRAMIRGGAESWNVRDRHMNRTLERLLAFHDGPGIVWAHNTHVGDARATDMADRGKVNLGQLAREERGDDDVAVVGFGTHRGSVVAGERWGAPMERMSVPAAREGSHGDVFHRAGIDDGIVRFERGYDVADAAADELRDRRGHRAIGVVYDPRYEGGNYVPTVLPDRYDAFVHVDETTALHPLGIEGGKVPPAAYPWGV